MTMIFKVPSSTSSSSHIAARASIASRTLHYLNSTLLALAFLLAVSICKYSYAIDLPDFKGLVERNGQAVVKVTVTAMENAVSESNRLPNFNEDEMPEFFQRFFEEMPQFGGAPPRSEPAAGFGSGFVLSEDGFIVTNAHVIKGASAIRIGLPDRREFDAVVIGSDPRTDVALLKVDATGLPTLKMGDSDQLKVGQWVLAIGSPFGFEYTATQGIVSALTRSLPNENYVPFIQTDVAVNPGNSGGPLFDLDGNVVGVNSQIYSRSGGYMGLSFAIPINIVQSVARQLQEKGYVSRGWLGVVIQDVNPALAESFGLDKSAGALIAQVTEGSPAADAGLKTGDVILSFAGNQVGVSSDLPPMVGSTEVGGTVAVEVLRNRERLTLDVTVRELVEPRQAKAGQAVIDTDSQLGITVMSLDESRLSQYGVDNGVLVTEVAAAGAAAEAGIVEGDVIVSFNQMFVNSADEFSKFVNAVERGQSVAVLVSRNKNPQFLALTVQ